MDKRLGLAIGLSLLVMVAWSALFPKPQPIVNKQVNDEQSPVVAVPATVAVLPQSAPSVSPTRAAGPVVDIRMPLYDISFDEQRAAIKEIRFKGAQPYTLPLTTGFLVGDPTWVFQQSRIAGDTASFVFHGADMTVTQSYILSNTSHAIKLEVTIKNNSAAPLRMRVPITLATLDLAPDNPQDKAQSRFFDAAFLSADKTVHHSVQKPREIGQSQFAAFRNQYFCGIVQPQTGTYTGWISRPDAKLAQIGLTSQEIIIPQNGQIGQVYDAYIGPQDIKLLAAAKPAWAAIVNYGFFDVISQILIQALELIQRLVHNWGIAIILFSVLIYAVLFPLSIKQMRSMKDMQMIQPKVEALRAQHKDNPQRMNKEMMELYKRHKVNPFGGCLPLVLQMPIFFALYQAILRYPHLRGARFLWIQDLSSPDRLFTLSTALPVIGKDINLLPVLMALGMFAQQKMTVSASGGANAEQQKMMTILFPIMFCFIFYNMPSGLVLYWFINSGLMLINQARLRTA